MSNELKIYLAGGMSGLSFEEQNEWRQKFINRIKMMSPSRRYAICNPVDYYNFEHPCHETEKEVIRFDLNKVRNSDLIVVNFNDHKSLGTMGELSIAYDRRIPIVGINEHGYDLHPWIMEMADRIFISLEDAVEYVSIFYLN